MKILVAIVPKVVATWREIWWRLYGLILLVLLPLRSYFWLYICIPLIIEAKRLLLASKVKQVCRTFELNFWWEWFLLCANSYASEKRQMKKPDVHHNIALSFLILWFLSLLFLTDKDFLNLSQQTLLSLTGSQDEWVY